jgi:PKD repeat protein
MCVLNKILFFCCVWAYSNVHAQLFFNKTFVHNIITDRILNVSNTFVTLGSALNNNGSRRLVLAKHSLTGDLLNADTISDIGYNTFGSRMILVNTEFYFTATFNTTPPFEEQTNDILFSKYNIDFQQQWSKTLGGSQTDQPFDILYKDSNLYLMNTTNSYGAGDGDFYLIKTDLEGNVLWERTYGSDKNEIGLYLTDKQDGNLLLSGYRRIEGINWNIYLVLVDADGNVLWEKDYGGNLNDYGGSAMATFDHSFIVYRNMNDGYNGPTVGHVEKLDGHGNLIWSKAFPYNTLSSFSWSKAIENNDGTLLVNCYVRNDLGKIINRLMKLDPYGNILWTKEYFTRPDVGQYIYDVKAMEDGGYVMCGSAFPADTNVQHGWLLRTNCFGEEGVQHPITTDACEQYDCSQFPITAYFEADVLSVDLADGGVVNFNNASQNTTSRVWSFGDGQIQYSTSNLTHTFTQEGIYDVQLIVYHGKCSDTFSLQIEVTNTANVTTNKALEELVRYYPNPNNGTFTLENNTNQAVHCEILDAMGKKIAANTYQSGQFVVNLTVPAGVYFIKTSQNGSELIQKMVVR